MGFPTIGSLLAEARLGPPIADFLPGHRFCLACGMNGIMLAGRVFSGMRHSVGRRAGSLAEAQIWSGQSGVVLHISPVQPLKRSVGLVTECVNRCDLERPTRLILGN
jgi:hypothetical protein